MIEIELDLLRKHLHCRRVLAAYAPSQQQAEQVAAEAHGWSARVADVEGVANEQLPRVHGKLIAFGLLNFQLTDRKSGVLYQLSPLGQQALVRLQGQHRAEDPGSSELTQSA